ncbi:MAG: DUF2851 family protein [Marinilabiliaceae bacterium]
MLSESFLQYVWGHRLYSSSELVTSDGRIVEILNPGRLNTDAGPDFFNAQLRSDGVTWAGNIEIHLTSDDWFRHGHESDPAYDNVILHVVGKSTGRPAVNSRGDVLPEVELAYDAALLSRYEELEENGKSSAIRCAKLIPDIPEAVKSSWLDSLLLERMEVKCGRLLGLLDYFKGDVDQAFFATLARAMGCKVNAEPMEILARATPLRVLVKHSGVLQSEAVILGQAGLLSLRAEDDDYTRALRREYEMLRAKFNLEPIDGSLWKYARLRPQNFPDIRLVQLAAIVRALPGNFASCLALPLDKVLSVSPSDYWRGRYKLGADEGAPHDKVLGENSRRLIMINAVVPFAFAMAHRFGNVERKEAAVDMLRSIKMESNFVLRQWASAGLMPADEAEAQALIHLYSAYCEPGECLRCRFGHFCVSRGVSPAPFVRVGRGQ